MESRVRAFCKRIFVPYGLCIDHTWAIKIRSLNPPITRSIGTPACSTTEQAGSFFVCFAGILFRQSASQSLIVSRTFFVLTVLTVLTVSPQKRSIWSIWSCTFFITPCKHKNLHWHKWHKWHKLSFNTHFSAISATSATSFFCYALFALSALSRIKVQIVQIVQCHFFITSDFFFSPFFFSFLYSIIYIVYNTEHFNL